MKLLLWFYFGKEKKFEITMFERGDKKVGNYNSSKQSF